MTVRVLLVDDVAHVRLLVRKALRLRGGFEVVGEADDGAGAVRHAAELRPDVVVLDLGLPDLAGHEVLTQIRSSSPASKVVVFSGSMPSGIEEQIEGYAPKDAELDYLLDLIESVGHATTAHAAHEARLELPQDPTSARLARRFVGDRVRDWGLEHLLDDALLVTSELAANAVTHAASTCEIRLSLTPGALRIEVTDSGSGTPEPQPRSFTEEHGRGLVLIDAITNAWGLDVVPGGGKVVWAELARPA